MLLQVCLLGVSVLGVIVFVSVGECVYECVYVFGVVLNNNCAHIQL